MEKKYVKGREASKILGIHQRTLYQWEQKGNIETIRTVGGQRMYNIEKYINDRENNKIQIDKNNIIVNDLEKIETDVKLNICYIRVSSISQKSDLEHQRTVMINTYPKHIIIEDIGSGLNLNNRGIKKIINLGIEGKINELVVAYKDRLTRFGFEMIEDIISTYSKGKITILYKKEKIEPQEELVIDVLAILNVYVAKMNGLRKYKIKKDKEIQKNIGILDVNVNKIKE
jgi:putative resolvase